LNLKKNGPANALKGEKRICKEFGLNVGMMKSSFAKDRKPEKKVTLTQTMKCHLKDC